MKKVIEVVPYNAQWSQIFETEAIFIKEALGDNCIDIHHIGSTSVLGLAAKPKIDIIAVVKGASFIYERLEKIGFYYRGEYNIPLHYGFSKRGEIDFNLHVYEKGHPEIELNLMFRDYLRNNVQVCNDYARLKQNLAQDESSFIIQENSAFTNYTLRKGDFIRKVLKEIGFNRIRILKCNDETEWNAAKYFRDIYFFGPHGIDDPYTWTFNHKEHVHLILYEGCDIAGYAHIQLWPDNRAAIRIIVINEDKRNQNLGSQLLGLCEKWLKALKIKSVHAESRQASLRFYLKNGYVEMPFNDPEAHESDQRDISVGKLL